MKIIELKSSNIKKIKAIELNLDNEKNVIVVSGKNGQGKSSVLDSIWYALGGKKIAPGKPIRDGEERGEIVVKVNDYVVKRTFTDSGSYLSVQNSDGSKYSNPQEFLNYIVGNLSFDPLRFSRLDNKKQIDELINVTGINLEPLNQEKKDITQERLLVGRQIKSLPIHSEAEIVSAKKMIKEHDNIASVQELLDKYQMAKDEIAKYQEIQRSIESAKQQILDLQQTIKELEKTKEPSYDLALMKTKIDSVQEINNNVNSAHRINDDANLYKKTKKEYANLTKKIMEIDNKKAEILSKAKMPINGLAWDEDGVTYNNIPYDQISAAEQLRVSMAIAMASNPKLRVILIRDGSLLDKDNMKIIEEMAKDKDFQVWLERVDDSGKVGIYLEDGQVKSIN